MPASAADIGIGKLHQVQPAPNALGCLWLLRVSEQGFVAGEMLISVVRQAGSPQSTFTLR